MADRTSTVRVNVVTDASGAGAMLGKFGRVAGVAALGLGAVAVGAVVGADKLATFGDVSDDANAKIKNVVKTMGLFRGRVDEVSGRVEDMAKKVSQATAVDINSIKATQAKLLTFKELAKTADTAGGAFDRATKAAVDMAALGFGTAETNAIQLGKALQDPANGLAALKKTGALTTDQIKKIGDEFKRTGDISKAQADILKAVEQQVGGTAEATAGGFEKMKNNVSLFANELALKALPYLDRFGTFMNETGGPALAEFGRQAAEVVVPALRKFGEFLVDRVIPGVQRLGKSFEEKVLPTLVRFGAFVRDEVIPALIEFAGWVEEHVVPVVKEFLVKGLERARDAFNDVRDAVKRNQPQLEDMFEKFKKVATFLVDKLGPVFADIATGGLPVLGAAITTAIDLISNMWTAWNTVWDIVKKVAGAIQDVIDKMKNLPGTGALGDLVGAVTRGSAGTVLPGSQFPDKAPLTVNIPVTVQGYVGDELTLAKKINEVLDLNNVRFGVTV